MLYNDLKDHSCLTAAQRGAGPTLHTLRHLVSCSSGRAMPRPASSPSCPSSSTRTTIPPLALLILDNVLSTTHIPPLALHPQRRTGFLHLHIHRMRAFRTSRVYGRRIIDSQTRKTARKDRVEFGRRQARRAAFGDGRSGAMWKHSDGRLRRFGSVDYRSCLMLW